MKLNLASNDLHALVAQTTNECMQSQTARQSFYQQMRQLYLRGSIEPASGRVNKIRPIVDRLSSFLYSPGSVRFWVQIPPEDVNDVVLNRIDPVVEAIEDAWSDTGLDLMLSESIDWSLVYGCSILYQSAEKMTNGEISLVSYLINPGSFGVYREDQPDLLKQEAVCMETYLTEHELKRLISAEPEPKQKQILAAAEVGNLTAQATGRVFVSNLTPSPSAQGIAPANWTGQNTYEPDNSQVRYKIRELYAWSDTENEYRVFTISGGFIIRDVLLEEITVPGRFPFVKICPHPLPEYFWGFSLADALQNLQNWYQQRMDQSDELLKKMLNPPKFAVGVGGLQEERIQALNRPGGIAIAQQPGGTIQDFKVELPKEAFALFELIDELLSEESNMRPAQFGRKENTSQARTEGIFSNIMRVGAAPIRRKATVIERQIADAANQLWRMMRRYSTDLLPDTETGSWFYPADFPEHSRVVVDGHSTSPLFVEDYAQLAEGLFRASAIDQETLIDLLHPPLYQMMKHRLKRIQMAKLVAANLARQQQDAKRSGKGAAAAQNAPV